MDPIFLSVNEAATVLGVSRWRVYELLNEQKIESKYEGRRRLVVVTSLREYAESLPAYRDDAA